MLAQFTRPAVWLGILGTLAIAPAALSQIPVTGGRITGDAGFFVPDTGNTVLFDAGTRTLRLETPNGVTVDSRFIPTSSSLAPIGNRLPGLGDTGTLFGLLSGRAFDPIGNPFFFFNVPTNLNFILNSFVSDSLLRGTLINPISPGAIASTPRVFLPVQGVLLNPFSSGDFSPELGNLYLGSFDANLPSGLINLPPAVRFGTPLVTEFAVPDLVVRSFSPIVFQLAGQGVPNFSSVFDPNLTGALRYDSSSDPFAFVNFNIQIEGTPLAIAGTARGTVIEVNTSAGSAQPRDSFGNFLGFGGTVSFSVTGRGIGTLYDLSNTSAAPVGLVPNSVGFAGNSSTLFNFRDAFGGSIAGQGNLTGFNLLGVFPVVSSFSNLTPPTFNTVDISNLGSNLAAAPVIPPPNLLVGSQTLPGDTSGSTTGTTDSVNTTSTSNVFSSGDIYSGADNFNTYSPSATQVAYTPVGFPSRVFPGLGGYEPVSSNATDTTDTSGADFTDTDIATGSSLTDYTSDDSGSDWYQSQAADEQSWSDWYQAQAEDSQGWSDWYQQQAEDSQSWSDWYQQQAEDSQSWSGWYAEQGDYESAASYANKAGTYSGWAVDEQGDAATYTNWSSDAASDATTYSGWASDAASNASTYSSWSSDSSSSDE
ncbi:MAG TPA: hypothetical protein V6C85_02280 [Allocoleopsis sp.]